MKANELRIGNYVAVKGVFNCPNFRIDEIRLTDRGYVLRCYPSGDMQIYLDAPLDMVEPIRLTPGILEACGFERDGKGEWRYRAINYTNIYYLAPSLYTAGAEWGVSVNVKECILRPAIICLYLHNLQNKFYAITGKELDVKW